MLESGARSQGIDAGATGATTKRNPFELLTSIFAKKKSLVQENDLDVSEEGDSTNDENLFPCESDTKNLTLSTPKFHRPSSASKGKVPSESDVDLLMKESISSSPSGSSKRSSVKYDLEALHLSRQDNPYLQHLEKLSSQEERPPSLHLEASCVKSFFQGDTEQEGVDLHQHLIRSPPPQFPQNVSRFIYSRANSPRHQTKDSSSSLPEIVEQNSKNGKKAKFLNPIQCKSDMDVMDPSIRKVLEYQRRQLLSGIQYTTSSNLLDISAPPFVAVTPTYLREVSYHAQSRCVWVHAKGSRPVMKRHSSDSAVSMCILSGAKDCCFEKFPQEEQESKKLPLGPINIGRTCTRP